MFMWFGIDINEIRRATYLIVVLWQTQSSHGVIPQFKSFKEALNIAFQNLCIYFIISHLTVNTLSAADIKLTTVFLFYSADINWLQFSYFIKPTSNRQQFFLFHSADIKLTTVFLFYSADIKLTTVFLTLFGWYQTDKSFLIFLLSPKKIVCMKY